MKLPIKYSYAIVILFLCCCKPSDKHHDIIIANVNIVNVINGKVHKSRWVGIDNERITRIYDREIDGDATIIVDGTNKYLIPGLWDMHAHDYYYYRNLIVANGVAGVRDMWGDIQELSQVRKQEINDQFIAPEVYSSGTPIDGPGPDSAGKDIAKTRSDIVKILNRQKKEGVDFFKILNQLSPELYYTVAQTADSLNIPFAGHVPFKVSIWEAVSFKQKSVEHSLGILEASSSRSDSLLSYFKSTDNIFASWSANVFDLVVETFDEKRFDSLTTVVANSDIWLVPTLVAARGWSHKFDVSYYNDSRKKYLHPATLGNWNIPRDTSEITSYKKKYEFEKRLMGKMINGGVKFLAASDAPSVNTYPGFSLHEELQLFAEAGFTNLQAIQTATLNPAIFINRTTDYGTVDELKYASLLLLNSNPLDNIENTKDINSVFLKGHYISRQKLDSLLSAQVRQN